MTPDPKPWQDSDPGARWKRETPKAFAAFTEYVTQGEARSVTAVAQALDVSRTHIGRWSAQWWWVKRAAAWDDDVAEAARLKAKKDRLATLARHRNIGKGLQNEVVRLLHSRQRAWEEHDADPLKNAKPEPLTWDQARLVAKTGVEIERIAMGEATERLEIRPRPVAAAGDDDLPRDLVAMARDDPELADHLDRLAQLVESKSGGDGGRAHEEGDEPGAPVGPGPAPRVPEPADSPGAD